MGDEVEPMKIMIDIGHPGQAYFFKNFIQEELKSGNEVKVTARDKEMTIALLSSFGYQFEKRGDVQRSLLKKGLNILNIDRRLYQIGKKFKPDILLGFHNPYIAHVSKILRKPNIIFTDTEGVKYASALTFPFADVICTPCCFRESVNEKKHICFNGYKELAYLHPNYFKPDERVIREAGFSKDEPYIVVRFISWSASHDIGLKGIKDENEKEFIHSLEDFGRVVITSEKQVPDTLKRYQISLPPEHIHSLLSFARLYIGEGGTMATESAILGTPAIHIESNAEGVAMGNFSGNFLDLRDNYDLLYFYPSDDTALDKAIEILGNTNSKKEWLDKRDVMLQQKIDVTRWMVDLVQSYADVRDKKNA